MSTAFAVIPRYHLYDQRDIERALSPKRSRLAQLRDAAVEIERRLVEEEDRAHQRELQSAQRKVGDALKARHNAAKVLSRALKEVDYARFELERHRGITDELSAAYEAILRDGVRWEWPAGAPMDEAWEIPDGLAEFLEAGPLQPPADRAEALEQVRATSAKQDEETLKSFALLPIDAILQTLPARLHPRAREIQAEYRAQAVEQSKRRVERDATRKPTRLGEERRERPPAPLVGSSQT